MSSINHTNHTHARANDPHPQVILATNIAETSVTINGIRHVVDAGWVKVRRYVASTGLDSLRNTQGACVCVAWWIGVQIPTNLEVAGPLTRIRTSPS